MILDIPLVERFCANSCFVLLFLTTLYYWSKIIFTGEAPYTQTGLFGFLSTVFCLTAHLIFRWVDSGHFPLSNLYESLLFLTWCLLILHIYIETMTKTLFLGVLTSPALLCLIAFTDFSLPPELQRSGPLVPALQSNWLIMHVTVMIASYAALILGCLVALAYLIFSQIFEKQKQGKEVSNDLLSKEKVIPKTEFLEKEQPFMIESQIQGFNKTQMEPQFNKFGEGSTSFSSVNYTNKTEIINLNKLNSTSFGFQETRDKLALSSTFSNLTQFEKFLLFLDNLSYRTIGIGFCFLTLGILSGAVWANETWGSYWSWDPKETWAFITWLTFACYLHSRLIGGWTGSKPAWIASFGFVIVWICYLGVNLLGQGLHSYGFIQF